VAEISAWQSLVAIAYHRRHLRRAVRDKLLHIKDSARILQDIVLGRGEPNDLLKLRDFVQASLAIRDVFRECMEQEGVSSDESPLKGPTCDWSYTRRLLRDLHDHGALASDIGDAIEESVPRPDESDKIDKKERPGYMRKDKWVMKVKCVSRLNHAISHTRLNWKHSYNQELSSAHQELKTAYEDTEALQTKMAHYYGTCTS
jgi:DNA mismatch repair ATPase MutS